MSVTEHTFRHPESFVLKMCVIFTYTYIKSLHVCRCLHVSCLKIHCSLDEAKEMELEDTRKGVWRLEVRGE